MNHAEKGGWRESEVEAPAEDKPENDKSWTRVFVQLS
jgi:hypothetical protein